MFLCLFCVWAHGSVSVCVCHVLHLYHLPVSPGHAPLFSPCLVLVCLIVFTWSSCALLLYIVFLPLVSLLVHFGVYLFHGLRVKLWSCASYFLSLILLYYILGFSSSCFFYFVNFYLVFVFSLFNFNLVFAVPVPFLDLGFLFLLFDYLVWIIYCFYLCSLFFCLVFFVFPWVSSCLLSCFALSCPLPRFPGLLPGSSSPLSLVKFLVLWVPTWQLDFCDFWDPLHATGSLLSCLSLPLELPPPCSSPLPPRTGSVVIPLAHIVLSALPLCLDWFTIHSPCCFQSMFCK